MKRNKLDKAEAKLLASIGKEMELPRLASSVRREREQQDEKPAPALQKRK